mmetsp:Transcript_28165/g.32270  ORF Transcript_28165/g.32270 Transcript_28165/m.32270 type:complete len:282 (-) Transcript_28165:12-857(-)
MDVNKDAIRVNDYFKQATGYESVDFNEVTKNSSCESIEMNTNERNHRSSRAGLSKSRFKDPVLEKEKSTFSKKQEVSSKIDKEKDSFFKFVTTQNQAKVFDFLSTIKSRWKKYNRLEEVSTNLSKKEKKKVTLYQLFERYIERKCFDKEIDFINFKDFCKIEFKTYVSRNDNLEEASSQEENEERKKQIKGIKTLYPSLMYEVFYYLCLYEFPDIKVFNKNYYDIIRKQIKGEPIVNDKKILESRKAEAWLYDEDELQKVIEDMENTHGVFKRINIDHLLS